MIQAYLIKEYHAVEKGLALPIPRPGFGIERITELISKLQMYIQTYGKDSISDISVSTLQEYLAFDKKHNKETSPLVPLIENLIQAYNQSDLESVGGTLPMNRQDLLPLLDFDFDSFFKSRHSIRDFAEEPVDTKIILDTIDTAKYAPSVCNRQAWKVYVIEHDNYALKKALLNVQNGNKGFGDKISSLIVVTGKLSSFFSYERYQVYIDGGMFAMSIVLGLHSKGLATCCLNTSYNSSMREAFNNALKTDDDCVPIMFIAVGHLKDNYKVANSKRRPLSELVEVR